MHLNKLKKNYGSTGKINTNTIGGLDLAEVERGIATFLLLLKSLGNLTSGSCLVLAYLINEGLIL